MTNAAEPAKRLLVVCNDSDYFVRHRLAVVRHLVAAGVQVTVIAGGNRIAAEAIDGWFYVHTPIKRFGFAPAGDALLWLRTFSKVRSFKPDAVHLVTIKPMVFSGLAALAARVFCGWPKRILVTIPGLGRLMSSDFASEAGRPSAARFVTERVARFLAGRQGVHFSFETSHDRGAWIARRLVTNEVASVIEGAGVDPREFSPRAGSRQPGPLRVLFASRLLKSKGLDTFLEVARRLSGRGDIEFFVAGIANNEDPDHLEPTQLAREPAIRFFGEVKHMPALLRSCDIVCLPTRYGEGIPRILIEAAASGLASVASNVPGCREVVVDGETGRLVDVGNRDMVVVVERALVGYLDHPDLVRKHGDAAYSLFRSRGFDQDSVTARFRQLLGV